MYFSAVCVFVLLQLLSIVVAAAIATVVIVTISPPLNLAPLENLKKCISPPGRLLELLGCLHVF